MKSSLPPESVAPSVQRDELCRTREVSTIEKGLGSARLLGYEVRVVEESGDHVRFSRWLAPALSCAELFFRAEEIKPGGSRRATREMIATKVTIGEPDGKLFEANYQEVAPSLAVLA